MSLHKNGTQLECRFCFSKVLRDRLRFVPLGFYTALIGFWDIICGLWLLVFDPLS